MGLDSYLKNIVSSVREDYRYSLIEVWKKYETENSSDAYGRTTAISSGSGMFSGAVGWGRTIQRKDTSGGYYSVGDVEIGTQLSVKTGSGYGSLLDDNVYLVAEDIPLKILRIVDTTDTDEMVIYCEKIGT